MSTTLTHSLPRRVTPVAAAILAGGLLMAGCGGSSHGTSPNNASAPGATTSSTGAANTSSAAGASPGSSLAASLTRLMTRNQPYLKDVAARCPSSTLPTKCSFTATAEQPKVLKIKGLPAPSKSAKGPAKQRVAGTIKVIPTHGKSFTYSLTYAPVK